VSVSDEEPVIRHAPKGPLKARDHMETVDHTDTPRCTARAKHSGERCKRRPIPGGTVCVKHGGGAPQVQLAALERLKSYQHKAIDRLFQLAEQQKFPSTALSAVKDVLDRTMGKPTETMQVTGADGGPVVFEVKKPW
jgi:hypothetical protein